MQTRFKFAGMTNERKTEFGNVLQKILQNLRKEGITPVDIEKLVMHKTQLERIHTKFRSKPEDVTKNLIIEPILDFLGYRHRSLSSGSNDPKDRKEADYSLMVGNERILVEAEPLNKELLRKKNQGVEQLQSYLERKSFRSDLGIATNGFEWILIKYDTKSYAFKQMSHIDLRAFFYPLIGQQNLVETDEKLNEILMWFYYYFSNEYILAASQDYSNLLEEKKENVTRRFYEDYIRYVFGYDKMTDKKVRCLLTAIRTPPNTSHKDERLFAITLMSRLIFVKFLEDKRLVNPNFQRTLLRSYRDNNIPSSFYRSYLQPLFYDVLNTPPHNRKPNVMAISEYNNIPYLNGGLFREVVENETQYDVDNDIVELIIEILEKYAFTLEDNPESLNPDILGLVFEKTINYLTGEGTDRRRDLGAYYTPDDVTTYICKETIRKRVFEVVIEYLKEIGWKSSEIDQYKSLEDFLEFIPENPKTLNGIYQRVSEITLLDPACGSGHFLSSAMKELFHIRRSLMLQFSKRVNNFQLKKDIITSNLFGVDIESSAVEIARLRLWLSLIEDLDRDREDKEQIETLPNIEYNIFEGNSLLGFTEPLSEEQMTISDDQTTTRELFQQVDELKIEFRTTADPKRAKQLKEMIEERLNERKLLLNKKLLAYLASDRKTGHPLEAISKMNPFHWRLMFSEVLARDGGFDLVIANPPYVEQTKIDYPTMRFDTSECGNLYAYFVEIGLKMLKEKGRIGIIVPLSAFCTQRMSSLIALIESNCSEVRLSHFGWRPSKLFENVNRALSIMLARKQSVRQSSCSFFTTAYMKWYTEPVNERPTLFKNIRYHQLLGRYVPFIIPKIGSSLEENILAKIYNASDRKLGDFMAKGKSKHVLYYRTTGGLYWKIVTDFQPKFYKDNKQTESSRESHLFFINEEYKLLTLAIYNSNLFWWFYTINSNGRDLNPYDLKSLTINLDKISPKIKERLAHLAGMLMQDLKDNSSYASRSHKNAKPVLYQQISPRKSKALIDDIDRLLAKIYGFTDEETNFLIHFDERFRMGERDEMKKIPLSS